MLRLIRIYLLPGAVMQSVMIGGAYGTGREITQYFTLYGMGGGLLGLLVATVAVSVVFALSLAVAQQFRAYDYRRFSKVLLGRGWFLYELVFIALVMLVLAVITSASGSILADEFGMPRIVGGGLLFAAVGCLIFFGRSWVTTVLAFWSLLLYVVFLGYLVGILFALDATVAGAEMTVLAGWFGSGLLYTFYNVAAIPVVLYAAMAIESLRQALIAGGIGGIIAIAPAIMLHMSFIVDYPDIIEAELPVFALLNAMNIRVLDVAYVIIILGTFIETAAGSIQGIIERIDTTLFERRGTGLNRAKHAVIAVTIMVTAMLLSQFGVVALVEKGYGTIAWGFLLFYVVPLLTVGIYRLRTTRQSEATGTEGA